MRRLVLAAAASLLGLAPAFAGDYADREVIGFFQGGSVFAFEEYGVQDGSGFPYANIFLIDTATDSWLPDSPVRVLLQDESASLDAARQQAFDMATPLIAPLGAPEQGAALVDNPITELTGDPHHVEFLTTAPSPLPAVGDSLDIVEAQFPMPSSCPDFGTPIVGFDLVLTKADGTSRTLSHDDRIPASRGCPIGYGISDVIAYPSGGDAILVVIVNIFRIGFEGPDRRFIAIAVPLGG